MLYKMDNHLVLGASEADALSNYMEHTGHVPTDIVLLMNDTENCVPVKSDHTPINPNIEYHYQKCMSSLRSKYCNTKEVLDKMSDVLQLFDQEQLETIFYHLMNSPYNESDALYILCASIDSIPKQWHDALIGHISRFWITGNADDRPELRTTAAALAGLLGSDGIVIQQKPEPADFLDTLKRYAYTGTALCRLINSTDVQQNTLLLLTESYPRLHWVMDIYDLKQKLIRDGEVTVDNEVGRVRDHQETL